MHINFPSSATKYSTSLYESLFGDERKSLTNSALHDTIEISKWECPNCRVNQTWVGFFQISVSDFAWLTLYEANPSRHKMYILYEIVLIVWPILNMVCFYRPRLHETGKKSNLHGLFRFGHSIIYNRCLHETGTKKTPDSSHSACWTEPTDFRPAWIQTVMNVNRNTFQSGFACNLVIGTTHDRPYS
jgi:hypothetical protein